MSEISQSAPRTRYSIHDPPRPQGAKHQEASQTDTSALDVRGLTPLSSPWLLSRSKYSNHVFYIYIYILVVCFVVFVFRRTHSVEASLSVNIPCVVDLLRRVVAVHQEREAVAAFDFVFWVVNDSV